MPGFGEPEKRVRRAGLEQNIRPEAGETAGRIERLAKCGTGVQHKQRIRREAADVDRAAISKFERGVTSGPKLNRRKQTASEVAVAGWNSRIQDDAKLGLATLYHGQNFIADRLDQSHLH